MIGTVLLTVLGVLVFALLGLWVLGERGSLLRASTWEGMKQSGWRNVLNLKALHMYVYGRWTNQYISTLKHKILPRMGEGAKKWLSDRYHAKVITTEHAKALILVDRPLKCDLEQVIPYPFARQLVLNGPPDIAAYECSCRHAKTNPCTPTQVCMIVGRPFVDFILEHHPRTSRRISQAEALELLDSEHKRGHLHSAWFKDAMLDRFYAICNCCKCCCVGIEAMTKYGGPVIASSGYVAKVDEELCSVCGTCADACPFSAISISAVAEVDREKCMGCGVCTGQCSNGAITLLRDEGKGAPLDVRLMG
jgi:ferredoxin